MSELSNTIDAIIGKPFQLRGRGPEAFDCLGVVIWLTREAFGVDLPDPFGEACSKRIAEFQNRFIKLSGLGGIEPGDVLKYAGRCGISDQSVAFAQDGRWFVTAGAGLGVHRTKLKDLRGYPQIELFRLKENVHGT